MWISIKQQMNLGGDDGAYGATALLARRQPSAAGCRTGYAAVPALSKVHAGDGFRCLGCTGIAHCSVAEEGFLEGGMKRPVLRLAWRPAKARMQGVQPCGA
ncbi:MAG TPA: hypothetical protein PLZ16_01980 [Gammaproteobacteria bacterium]|nr:hypothetical protein [Gammaproteobacteria bacterium]